MEKKKLEYNEFCLVFSKFVTKLQADAIIDDLESNGFNGTLKEKEEEVSILI